MNKIVVTDRFFDAFQAPPFQSPTQPTTTLNKTQKLAKLFQRSESEMTYRFKMDQSVSRSAFIRNAEQEINRKFVNKTNLLGRSVNEVLHHYYPTIYSCKNSKLSNYSFEKTCENFPKVKEKFNYLLNHSFSQLVIANKKLDSLILKNQKNYAKSKFMAQQRKMLLEVTRDQNQKQFHDKPMSFSQTNEEYLAMIGSKKAESNSSYWREDPPENDCVVKRHTLYTFNWAKKRDLSVKRVICLKENSEYDKVKNQ